MSSSSEQHHSRPRRTRQLFEAIREDPAQYQTTMCQPAKGGSAQRSQGWNNTLSVSDLKFTQNAHGELKHPAEANGGSPPPLRGHSSANELVSGKAIDREVTRRCARG